MGSFPETYNDPFILFFGDFCWQSVKTLRVCIAPNYFWYRGSELARNKGKTITGKATSAKSLDDLVVALR